MVGFIRPKAINYPSIYHTFQARDLQSNKLVEYRVQDFPRDRYEEGVQFMIQNFFEHEAMGKTRRIKSDRIAVSEVSQFWREMLAKGFSIACFKQDSDDLVAMNVLDVSSIDDVKLVGKVQTFLSKSSKFCLCLVFFEVSISKLERCVWRNELCPTAVQCFQSLRRAGILDSLRVVCRYDVSWTRNRY